jgi:hypothetical protein
MLLSRLYWRSPVVRWRNSPLEVHHDGTVEVHVLFWRVFALRGEGTLDGRQSN